MSHTSTIASVVINDITALRLTIAELKGQGVKCELLENAVPRAYFPQQSGMDTPAKYVVKLEDSKYDVGLYARDGKPGLEARTDFFAGYVEKVLGLPAGLGPGEAHKMGRLLQTYAKHATIRQAAQQGHRVGQTVLPDGTVQLTITMAA